MQWESDGRSWQMTTVCWSLWSLSTYSRVCVRGEGQDREEGFVMEERGVRGKCNESLERWSLELVGFEKQHCPGICQVLSRKMVVSWKRAFSIWKKRKRSERWREVCDNVIRRVQRSVLRNCREIWTACLWLGTENESDHTRWKEMVGREEGVIAVQERFLVEPFSGIEGIECVPQSNYGKMRVSLHASLELVFYTINVKNL